MAAQNEPVWSCAFFLDADAEPVWLKLLLHNLSAADKALDCQIGARQSKVFILPCITIIQPESDVDQQYVKSEKPDYGPGSRYPEHGTESNTAAGDGRHKNEEAGR